MFYAWTRVSMECSTRFRIKKKYYYIKGAKNTILKPPMDALRCDGKESSGCSLYRTPALRRSCQLVARGSEDNLSTPKLDTYTGRCACPSPPSALWPKLLACSATSTPSLPSPKLLQTMYGKTTRAFEEQDSNLGLG